MIRTQFAEQNVEAGGLDPLRGKFIHEAAINLTRPEQAETVTKFSVLNGLDARFFDGDKSQICCDWRGELARRTHAHVVGYAFEPFEKI